MTYTWIHSMVFKLHVHPEVNERLSSSVLKKYSHYFCRRVPVSQHFLISMCLLKFLCTEHPVVGKSQACVQPSGGDRVIQRPSDCDGKQRTRLQV